MPKDIDFEILKTKKVKIVLSNGYVYHGILMSFGDDYLKISHNSGITWIARSQVCSVEEE